MSDIFPQTFFGVEYDPAYGEIESILSQLDESADPLSHSYEPPKLIGTTLANWPLSYWINVSIYV